MVAVPYKAPQEPGGAELVGDGAAGPVRSGVAHHRAAVSKGLRTTAQGGAKQAVGYSKGSGGRQQAAARGARTLPRTRHAHAMHMPCMCRAHDLPVR